MENRGWLLLGILALFLWWEFEHRARSPVPSPEARVTPPQPPARPRLRPGDPLPPAFAPFEAQLQATVRPFIRLTPKYGQGGRRQSKYLGVPYLPRDVPYPVDEKGRPLHFLAQLNFAELPPLDPYPRQGIVSFFVGNDDVWGLDVTVTGTAARFRRLTEPRNFRVLYFPTVDPDDRALADVDERPRSFLPVSQPCVLTATLAAEYVPRLDTSFSAQLGADFFQKLGPRGQELSSDWFHLVDPAGNKIGGYASFAQEDPRVGAPKGEDWLLLLQVDSAPGVDIMWGDGGVGNFFIDRKALLSRDFSRVLYSWDCS